MRAPIIKSMRDTLYLKFRRGPAVVEVLMTMPVGVAVVLASSNARAGVPSAKMQLSRNVRQPDHVLANSFAGHQAEPRPGAGEEWLARPEHDGMDVESILINQTKVGQAPCQVGSGYVDLPIEFGF